MNIYGPIGMTKVQNNVYFKTTTKESLIENPKKIAMIAGGSGITPMIQLVNSSENVEFKLIYSNKTVQDILCRKELQNLTGKLEVKHTLTRETEVPEGFSVGRINLEMVQEFFDEDTDVIAICGPPEFTTAAKEFCENLFEGYTHVGGKSGAFLFKN